MRQLSYIIPALALIVQAALAQPYHGERLGRGMVGIRTATAMFLS